MEKDEKADSVLSEWLEIQQNIAMADKDLRAAVQKGKLAPSRRVRKTIRELRKMLQALSKKLIAMSKSQVASRRSQKEKNKGH